MGSKRILDCSKTFRSKNLSKKISGINSSLWKKRKYLKFVFGDYFLQEIKDNMNRIISN